MGGRGIRGETSRRRQRLDVEVVKALRPGPSDYVVWDADVKRFGVRVYPNGSKVYLLRLRVDGRQKWYSIGKHGDPWTPKTAREEADRVLGQAANVVKLRETGAETTTLRHPIEARDAGKDVPTLAGFARRYLAEYAEPHKKPGTVTADRGLLGLLLATKRKRKAPAEPSRTILGVLGDRKVNAITPEMVTRLHVDWKDTPTRANRAVALISHMMKKAEEWGLRPDGSNPCRHVKRFRENKRERFLSAAELARLGKAIAGVKKGGRVTPFGLAAVQLLAFTGARASEILGLTWRVVDMRAGTARLSDSKTGAKTLYLSPPALQILKALAKADGNPHVIVGGRKGTALTLWGLESVWQEVRKAAKLDGVRLHDLRHSFASVAAAGGESLPVIGAMLGHTQAQTTKRYAHLSANPLKTASNAVAAKIAAAMGTRRQGAAKVRAFRR